MADWNAYHRQAKIEGLRKALEITEAIRTLASGHGAEDYGQRRACVRIASGLAVEIEQLEREGRQAVYTHFMKENDQ